MAPALSTRHRCMTAIRNDRHFTHYSTFQPNSALSKPLWDSVTIFFPPSLPSSSSTKQFPVKSHSCYLEIKLELTTPPCTLVDLTLGIWFIPTPFLTPTPKPTSTENNAASLCPQQIYSPLSSGSQCPHLQGAVAAWSEGFLLVCGKKRLPSVIRVLFSLNGARLCKHAPLHSAGRANASVCTHTCRECVSF